MKAAAKQLALGTLQTDAEEMAEINAGYTWREALFGAMRMFVESYMEGGLRGYDAAAAALDRRWGPKGRPVSASALRSALHDVERNNFRLEWGDWFAARSPEIAELMGRRVKPTKTPEQMIADLEAEIRESNPKHADQMIRRARVR